MTTITMLFLRGTFVASFFAIPMFHWDIPPGQTVGHQFGLYWSVAVPLTLTVILVWAGLWYWHNVNKQWEDPYSGPMTEIKKISKFEEEFYDFEYNLKSRDGTRRRDGDHYLHVFSTTKPLSKREHV
jgi:hypothetical protein